MSILLPAKPAPRSATPRLLDFGSDLTPPMGGAMQRLNRLGNRFAIDVTLPPMKEPLARPYLAALLKGKAEGVLLRFPQPGFDPGNPGAPVVDGAGQTGSLLRVRGASAGYVFKAGQFFSILHGGRRYLHQVNADVAADGTGKATLPITPMLRISPANGATCEFAQPMIEGFLQGNELPWTLDLAAIYGLSFTLTEVE